MRLLARFLTSPANWAGIALSVLALVPLALGFSVWGGWLAALVGYGVGFGLAGLRFGFPWRQGAPWASLSFPDEGDPQHTMGKALSVLRGLVNDNPDDRLSPALQARALTLCDQLDQLLHQWARCKSTLSLEDSFHARHIVLSYLPGALKTYLALPPGFAQSQRLANGQTAEDTLRVTLDDLSAKVLQLTHDLTAEDAQSFLNHSRFLQEKFGPGNNPLKPPGSLR